MKKKIHFITFMIALIAFSMNGHAQLPGSGNAYDFNSSSMTAPDSPSLNSSFITLEAWINADSWATNIWENVIISKDGWASGEQGYTLRSGANGSLSFNIGMPGNWHEVTSPPLMSTGQWYHVAGTYDGTTMRLYINGEEINTNAISGTISSGTYALTIGQIAYTLGGTRNFDGMIDEVRVWTDALPQSSIQDYMCKKVTTSHPQYSSLGGLWNFDDIGTVLDSSPNGNNASNFGATQAVSGAAIGDESIHSYAGPYNLTLPWGSTDSLQVESTSAVQTIHVYRVDSAPTDISNDGVLSSIDTTHYYGVFIGSNVAYSHDVSYHYGNNPFAIGDEVNLDLAGRTDGTISPWSSQTASVNIPSSEVETMLTNRVELMLGLTCTTINLDTSVPQSFCMGDSITVMDLASNTNYQWHDGSGPISGATTNSLVINQTGDYFLVGNSGSCIDSSTILNVTVNALPSVSFGTGPAPAVCENDADFPLTGSTPAGGSYSGTGIIGGDFSPSTAGPGMYWITYSYVDTNLCSASDSMEFTVYVQPATPVISAIGETMCVPSGGLGTVYNWELNGVPVASSGDTCYTALTNGNYTVVCVSADGCTSDEDLHVIDFIGIDEYDLSSSFVVTPNPTDGTTVISLPVNWSLESSVTVVDGEGRQLQVKNVSGGLNQFDLSNFDAGIYYFILTSNGVKHVKRVAKY